MRYRGAAFNRNRGSAIYALEKPAENAGIIAPGQVAHRGEATVHFCRLKVGHRCQLRDNLVSGHHHHSRAKRSHRLKSLEIVAEDNSICIDGLLCPIVLLRDSAFNSDSAFFKIHVRIALNRYRGCMLPGCCGASPVLQPIRAADPAPNFRHLREPRRPWYRIPHQCHIHRPERWKP